jgi:D-cysteine desulfhydrase family pyridoxal phosphate-dependent enzyme
MPQVFLRELPRFPLAEVPTPVQRLKRLSAYLGGPGILMKRDDMTGLAFGGNKTRKLEFLLAEALARGADTLLTAGAAQSNHCRQTAAAAAKAGKRCDLVLGGAAPSVPEGNLLLDTLLGARIHWAGSDRRGETLEYVASTLREEGLNPFLIPYGGSSSLGAAGYVMAMTELAGQLPFEEISVDAMVFASSSGGTHAGLIAGALASGYTGRILGVCVEKGEQGEGALPGVIISLARGTARLLGAPDLVPEGTEVFLEYRYTGEGYGVLGPREREAIRLLARLEGIFLDPVYTAKAMGGLIDMIARGEFTKKENVLFWHTGGTPALFAYTGDIT